MNILVVTMRKKNQYKHFEKLCFYVSVGVYKRDTKTLSKRDIEAKIEDGRQGERERESYSNFYQFYCFLFVLS